MSRAFVKEGDGSDDELPEKLVSDKRNLVTEGGLAELQAEAARLQRDLAAAQVANDRAAIALASRDLRYVTQRVASAEAMPAPAANGVAQFGSSVRITRDDGRTQTFRIVGEDEADPAHGTISYVSPFAQAVLGKRVGDVVRVVGHEAEIDAIS